MKNYIKKVIVFLIPIAVILFIPSWILFKSGEAFYDIDKLIYSNVKKPYIVGYAYNGKGTNYEYFKFQKTVEIKPEILVLGSSRVLQFRDYMFNSSFYNAGFTVGTIEDYLTFLKLLPTDYHPKLLIMGFDQWMFNKDYYSSKVAYSSDIYTKNKSLDVNNGFLNLINVYKEVYNGKIRYKKFIERSDTLNLGLNAVINKTGFRNDGSFDYGINHKYYSDFKTVDDFFSREIDWIDNGEKYFVYGEEINKEAVKKYEELLIYCKNKNIKIVSFLPPLPVTINTKIQVSGNYSYIDKLSKYLIPISEKYNSEFYDFTNKSETSDDKKFIDGHHGNEKVYIQVLKSISRLNTESQIIKIINLNN